MRRIVRDDAERPDPAFAELYASFPDAVDLDPWLAWCRAAAGPVLYVGVGAGRLAVPLAAAGVELVGVDAHPGMLARLRERRPEMPLVEARIERLDLGRRFPLVVGPSGVLADPARLAGAARHTSRRVGLELMNPHWLLAGGGRAVRVLDATSEWAEVEVDYSQGWTHRARVRMRWPEDVDALLAGAGLELEVMSGQDPDADLEECPTYFVLGRLPDRGPGRRRRRAPGILSSLGP